MGVYLVLSVGREEFIFLSVSFSYLYCLLWHINPRMLFNAKSSSYIYIKYIRFGLVGSSGISNLVVYLMSNPIYIYIYIYIKRFLKKHFFLIVFSEKLHNTFLC